MNQLKTRQNKIAIKSKRSVPLPKHYSLSKKTYVILCVVTFCILISTLYFNTVNSSFHLDDKTSIVENEAIQDITNLSAIWKFSPTRFITYFSFAGNYHFNNLNVTGYHLVNILIHLCVVLLVWWFVLLTFSTPVIQETSIASHKQLIAFFCAALFAAHPVQTQAVTYIVQRLASLSTMFYLLSLCLYINGRYLHCKNAGTMLPGLFYMGSAASAALGMFTKETVFTLPVIIVLYELLFFKSKYIFKFKFILPLLFLLVIIPVTIQATKVIDFNQLRAIQEGPEGISLLTPGKYLLTQFRVLITYLRLLLFPINQNLDYNYPVAQGVFEYHIFLSAVFLLLILLEAILLYRHHKLLAFSIFWFFITLIPESSIIPIRDVIFEHRLYLPVVGYSIFLIALLDYLVYKRSPQVMFILVSIILLCYSSLTYARNRVWSSELTLWNDTISKSPDKERPYINRGFAYAHVNDFDKALADFDHALVINPNSAMAYYNRGLAYYYKNEHERAVSDYTTAIRFYPKYWQAFYNRGLAHTQKGQFDPAVNDYSEVIKLKPDYYDAYYNRGIAYGKLGLLKEALHDFTFVVQHRPNMEEAYYNKGLINYLKKDYINAITDYSRALSLNSKNAKIYNNRAITFFVLKEYQKAWDDIQKAQMLGYQVDANFLQQLTGAVENHK
jgi:tetratricopeptide (TPR) repeat protein